jgi:predicted metalloprotease with PDZ domain
MSLHQRGILHTIVPGSVADSAKLAEQVQVIGVNGKKYSANRLKDAIAESPVQRHIELLILKGELFETVKLPYDEGPKYLDLVRNRDQADLLKEILTPKN